MQALLAAGEPDRAATLALRGLGPEILAFLQSILRDDDDAMDAFQGFAEHLWKGLVTFRGEASLRTWAYRLAAHAAASLRRESWRRRGQRLLSSEISRITEELRSNSKVREELQRRSLDALRSGLDLEDRTLLILRVDRRMSWQEVASVLSREGAPVEPMALAKRFERLKDRLAEAARREGLVE